jgi:predicted ATPase
VREVSAMAATRGFDVFTAFCESHTSQVPFHAVARLLRAVTGIKGLEPHAARARIRAQFPDTEPEDLVLFDDLLGIGDPDVVLPKIDPDARRRRLTALVNSASLARTAPALYVIEDAHWLDEVSDSMLADFLTVIPQTPSVVLVTYRPEYRGELGRVGGAKTIALAPLSDPETAAREPWSANTCRGSHRLPSIHRATARRRPVRTCAAHLAITGISPRSPREEHLNGTTAISRAPRKPWPMMSC